MMLSRGQFDHLIPPIIWDITQKVDTLDPATAEYGHLVHQLLVIREHLDKVLIHVDKGKQTKKGYQNARKK